MEEKSSSMSPSRGGQRPLGFRGGQLRLPTLGCPPFSDKADMLVNVHSTLQMPSKTPVLTVLDPGNCALAVKRIFASKGRSAKA